MTDDEFLAYVHLHSTTDRALFSREQIERLYALAGEDVPPEVGAWVSFYSHHGAHDMVAKARLRLSIFTSQALRA